MSRLKSIQTGEAQGKTKELFAAVNDKLGGVPNFFQGIAVSPAALEGLLGLMQSLEKGGLSFAERVAVALAVSEANECGYCVAAHCALGKMAGLKDQELAFIRKGTAEEPKLKELIRFVSSVHKKKGSISDKELEQVKSAGYSDAQITEALLVMGQATFMNLYNKVSQTPVDFPAAAAV